MFLPSLPKVGRRVITFIGIIFMFGTVAGVSAQTGFVNPDIDGTVNDVVLQQDGKIVVAGSFAAVGGQPRSRVARLNADGTLDVSFQNPQVVGSDQSNNHVSSIAVQPDGKIVIGGLFVSVGGQARNYLARLNTDGSLDQTFTPVISSSVAAIALQPDGKIVIGGFFTSVSGQNRNRAARLNSDGSLDTSFVDPILTSPAPSTWIGALAVQTDGKILIGGYFTSVSGQSRAWGTRLNSDGTLDSGFNLSVSGQVEQFRVLSDGKIVLCGFFGSVNGTPRTSIARINNDGSLDPTFANVGIPSGSVSSFDIQADGKLVVGGNFSLIAGVERRDVARLNSDGTFDQTFLDVNANFGGTFSSINDVVRQPDGKILVGGQFSTVGHQTRKNLVRLLADGTLDLPPAQTLTVTKVEDSNDGSCNSDCSLREAIAAANASNDASLVNFEPQMFGVARTITLTSGELVFEQNRRVSIAGPGSSLLTISGNNASRVFRVRRDVIATMAGVTISNGSATEGGGIYVEPNGVVTSLTIASSVISNNAAGSGGGIRTSGSSTLNISNSTITGNTANYSPGVGGLLFDTGVLSVANTTISNNISNFQSGGVGGISTGGGSSMLTDLIVTGNYGTYGGGIGAGGTTTITNATITNNQSAVWGAGLYSGGTVNLIGSTIAGNTVTNTDGSGGGIVNYGQLNVSNSIVRNNSAANGGGVFTAGGLTMTESTIADNSAGVTGGGIYNNSGGTSGMPVHVNGCSITGNTAVSFAGGIQNRSLFDVYNSTIANNSAGSGGGAAFNVFFTGQPAVMNFVGSTIRGNRSNASGGAIQNQAGTVNVLHSTLSSNTAVGGGGAVLITQNGALNLSFATIAFNIAGSTGGIRISAGAGTVSSNNSIIARNTGRNSGADFSGEITSQGYNLIGRLVNATIVGDATGNLVNINPDLDPVLRNNGGGTLTHALQPNSPAIDSGKSSVGYAIDQRGLVRPYDFLSIANAPGGNGADIGSFERQPDDAARFSSPFDFDGDGKTDLGIFRPSVGEWWINHSGNGNTVAVQFGNGTDTLVPADYTGDGKTDIAIWRPSTGEWYILRSEDNSYYAPPFGAAGDAAMPADYDGDGKADLAVFRPSNATWYIARSGGGTTIEQFGATGDQPVPADYDGDGRTDMAIFRPSSGQWWLNRSADGVIAYGFGNSTDKTVQGDYTGDGKADSAIWRPSTGEWYILRSEDTTYYSAPFGLNTDVPAPGDYDGDGKFDTTVFRPSNATWYVQRTTSGTLIQQLGMGLSPFAPNC